MTLQEAYQALGLSAGATGAQVKMAYRRLVAGSHPDRGGRAADFIRVRAAYEILSGVLKQERLEDDMPIPPGLRDVIDAIVADFREQQCWAEGEALRHLDHFEKRMAARIEEASRDELRRFSAAFGTAWDAQITALFRDCNARCDCVTQRYESWYTENTQQLFDVMYRKELLAFALRRRFWEVFLVLGALAGALSVVVGWEGPWRRWLSVAMILVALALSFLVYRWFAQRERKVREKVEPLSVVVFELDKDARFPTEATLRRGRQTTAALGLTGLLLANAASSGLAMPIVGALAGTALGGALDRLLNPLEQVRESMLQDLERFMAVARPQVTGYVLEAHRNLLNDLRGQILESYQDRARKTVRLLTSGS